MFYFVFTEQEKWPGTWWKHLVVAGIASAVAGTFMTPSDSLKVKMQVVCTLHVLCKSQSNLKTSLIIFRRNIFNVLAHFTLFLIKIFWKCKLSLNKIFLKKKKRIDLPVLHNTLSCLFFHSLVHNILFSESLSPYLSTCVDYVPPRNPFLCDLPTCPIYLVLFLLKYERDSKSRYFYWRDSF